MLNLAARAEFIARVQGLVWRDAFRRQCAARWCGLIEGKLTQARGCVERALRQIAEPSTDKRDYCVLSRKIRPILL